MTRGLIIAAPRSGSGKTIVTLGVLAALRRRGVAVRAAKSGPDYIDPAFHAAAAGTAGVNLDSWAMAPAMLDGVVAAQAAGAEILVIESSMGLFDGVGEARLRRGAAADLAARYGLPVVLVLDVSGQSQSAAAVARGFIGFDPDVDVAGVILNLVGSARHREQVCGAMAAAGVRVFGAVMRDAALALPERHLGLVQAGEHSGLGAFLDGLADVVERAVDLDGLLAVARGVEVGTDGRVGVGVSPPGQRVALARDDAFSFVYPHLMSAWRSAGAEIVAFSPLADEVLPEDCDACWLPGGYPELHAGRLAAATRFQRGLRDFARDRPVHGECGGYMVLGEGLVDAAGERHRMVGLLGHETSFARRTLHLGYRQAVLLEESALGRAGMRLRGHEFHYASVTEAGGDAPLASLRDARGVELPPHGGRRGWVSGSFFHVIAAVDGDDDG